MKTLCKILVFGIFIFTVSCKNETKTENVEPNPANEELTKTTNYKESGNFKDGTYQLNSTKDSLVVNWNLDNSERQKNLYTTFKMTESQIQDYEKALESWMSDVENPYEKLSANQRIKKEDDILKDILNDSQYKAYQKWANKNDDRGM